MRAMIAGIYFLVTICTQVFGETNALEIALLKARGSVPTICLLGSVFVARTNAPSPAVLEQSLKACAAGLLYLNNTDVYKSKVRPLIADSDIFEESIKVPCDACKGGKSVMINCSGCKGSGRCTAFRCDSGSIYIPAFDGNVIVHSCSKCKGSAVCAACKGEKQIAVLCQSCKGSGKMFSHDAALAVYRAAVEEAFVGVTQKNNHNGLHGMANFTRERTVDPDIQKLIKAAESGDALSQLNLGMLYGLGGSGVEQSYSESARWIQKSAVQGCAEAQERLGWFYSKGVGVAENDFEAAKWYRKAAEQGGASAQTELGTLYALGKGVDQSYIEAVKWFRKAAEQGYAFSQLYLGMCYETGKGVGKSDTDAVKWYRKAAEQDCPKAQCQLAACYLKGKGVESNDIESVKWVRRAAMLGNTEAQVGLGFFYIKGIGVEPSKTEAAKWFREAANQGDTNALVALDLISADQVDNKTIFEPGKRETLVNLQKLFGLTDSNELLVKLNRLTTGHENSRNWILLEQQTGILVEAARLGNLSGDQLMSKFEEFKVNRRKVFGTTGVDTANGVTAGEYESFRAFTDFLARVNARAKMNTINQ